MSRSVGQYELVRRIGTGGMAEVWMGRRASVGGATKSVAIKFMSARVASDSRHRSMFLEEARLSMLMTHSNVVQVFDAGEDEGRLYLVMEWVDGLNLAQLAELRRRDGQRWPAPLVGYILGEVLRGLAYAHQLGHEGRQLCVVHRDVTPHNVLVSTSGEVKLADFGVARLSTDETSGRHIKGKLRYMAPEQLAGQSREATVDLYGAGAVLHELLAGTRFRDEVRDADLYGLVLGGRIPALDVSDVPPELAALREGLLQPDPRRRTPSASRALQELSAWPGYRNGAAELAPLCRAYMGVAGPRSGIESLGPRVRPIDALADTVQPSLVTRTSSRAPVSVTNGELGSQAVTASTSASMPRRTPTPMPMPTASGRGTSRPPVAYPGPSAPTTSAYAAPAVSASGSADDPARRSTRQAVLLGVGVLAIGFLLGGVAVMALRGGSTVTPAPPGAAAPEGAPAPGAASRAPGGGEGTPPAAPTPTAGSRGAGAHDGSASTTADP